MNRARPLRRALPLGLLPLLLALGACGSGSDDGGGNEESAASGSMVAETVNQSLYDDPRNSTEPQAMPSPRVLSALPEAFLGRWGMVAADCEPGRADAKGLMTVAADRLSFYESRARATHMAQVSPGTVALDLSYTGEGQNWRRHETLAMVDAGRTLIRDAPDGSSRYSRCPA